MKHIINLTPHKITVLFSSNDKLDFLPSGRIARLRYDEEDAGVLDVGDDYQIPITRHTDPVIDNLPEPKPDTFYLVPLVVAQAAKRVDVLSPAKLIRDPDGYPIGCTGFMVHV